MTYSILPLNLQQLWQDQSDRITRLELAYNGPQVSADAAQSLALTSQSVATNAQVQAINAGIQANNAASQATIAQSQATIASTQAVDAQMTQGYSLAFGGFKC